MNYRHQFHAGNFADVFKHVALIHLVRGLQRKERGFLYLDTHAGRGRYDLTAAARGDSLERQPEWPAGIGRLWGEAGLPALLEDYMALVRDFDGRQGFSGGVEAPRFYPGSPWIVRTLMRPQDRMALCEKQPEECAVLTDELGETRGVSVHAMDGYTAIRAMLPPQEKRALVLIDPPFETQDEYTRIGEALSVGLQRMPAATYAIWYPLTERARGEAFSTLLQSLRPPPTYTMELAIAGPDSPAKLKGCGLAVINPPWQSEREFAPVLAKLAELLAVDAGAGARLRWVVPE